ncbi:hypothetical protein NKH18_40465 [Streptomyces sp. M10(2022)]
MQSDEVELPRTDRSAGPPTATSPTRPQPSWPTKGASTALLPAHRGAGADLRRHRPHRHRRQRPRHHADHRTRRPVPGAAGGPRRPAETADQLLGMFAASRAGEFAAVDSTLATLTGREPIALRTVLREQLPDNDGH